MLVIVRVNGHLKFLRVVAAAAVASTADETPFRKHIQICMWFNVVPPTTALISVSLSLSLSPYLIHKDTLSKLIIGDELVCSLCALCSMCCYLQF